MLTKKKTTGGRQFWPKKNYIWKGDNVDQIKLRRRGDNVDQNIYIRRGDNVDQKKIYIRRGDIFVS